MFAAGDYPNQHAGGAGLPQFIKSDSKLEDEDVVLWYTMGAHHAVRPEEWPVMPVKYIGFHLLPQGFFDGNPALDVEPSHATHHVHHNDTMRGKGNGRHPQDLGSSHHNTIPH